MILEGIIQEDARVLGEDGNVYHLPVRGTDEEGYPEVLIDAEEIGGDGWMYRQSVKPYIGMKVLFYKNPGAKEGFNYKIINKEKNEN